MGGYRKKGVFEGRGVMRDTIRHPSDTHITHLALVMNVAPRVAAIITYVCTAWTQNKPS